MPEARRFFVTQQGLSQDLVLSGTEHNHLAHVLRLRVGDEIIAVCGDEFDYRYKIKSITKSQTLCTFTQKHPNQHNPQKRLVVYLGVIKHDNLALAIEKLNEIGVTEAFIFKSAHCGNIPAKLEKLQIAAQQSCKQCGRSIPLKVRGVLSFDELLKELPQNAIFADESEKNQRISEFLSKTQIDIAVIVGPEGGFTDSERVLLRNNAKAVTLGNRILRAETAAITASSIILSIMGEL